jgi:hypothetical protein
VPRRPPRRKPSAVGYRNRKDVLVSQMKRISMSGSDIAVTDAGVADLVLEYAMHLGRMGTTDIVSVPVPDDGDDTEVDLLLGPASQIVLSNSVDGGTVERARSEVVAADLRTRIKRLTGPSSSPIADDAEPDPLASFIDFSEYGDPGTGERPQ